MAQNSSTPAQHADKQQNRTKPYRNYKPTGVMGLFDEQEREARQLQQPKFLDRLSKAVDFEMFRPTLEHVFGFMNQSMSGLRQRCVGFQRAAGIIGLINITYNLCRYEQIERLNLLTKYRDVNEEVTKK